jgi:hypothetical protein
MAGAYPAATYTQPTSAWRYVGHLNVRICRDEARPSRAAHRWFHQPRQARYRRGELPAKAYYRDSFDYPAITGQCLTSLPRRPAADPHRRP